MADVNANIGINIDSSNALAQLKALQRQISQFHTSISRSSEAAALAQKGLQKNLLNSINAIGAFSAEMRTVRTSAESFTNSLEKNKFSMREYFRYAGASTKTFGRLFKSEFDTIGKVAEERVKRLQTQYIKMGRDTNGAMKAMSIMPTQLNMSDYTTKIQIAAQKQALFNQLMKQGSTNLLNFGKNTQWAGRQLMVGFTLPLMVLGSTATKTFMEMEAQALRFRKVYGDLFTPQAETQAALDNIIELGKQFTKYGVAVSTTVGLAAEAAAAGFQGLDLQRQTAQATRLSILGQVESQKALETTISLQNAFGMSSEKLAESIDFLNAVENQTVVSLDDITTAIPKVAPVIQQLGGDVKDLTFFMAAMKEGGINASEGANALKSGLAALINPTKKASDMLAGFGINANAIVENNKGDLKATVIGFAEALNQLDPLSRARAIEQMFGKFQFARLSTLFANVAKDGNQAARVLSLANSSVEDLSALSEQELGMTADSAMNKFKKSVEDLKFALVPVGEAFLQALTPIIEFVGGILEKFSNLSDGTKKLITLLTVGVGAVGPVLLMTFGLLANGVANIIKLFLTLRGGYQRLTGQSQILGEQTQYMTMEQLDAAAAAHSLNQTHANLTQTFTAEVAQINKLIAAYTSAAGAARNFSMNNPGMMMPGRGARKFANGILSVPGSGNKDTVPAMLTPGEAVVPAEMAKKYAPLINGMIADNIPGFKKGLPLGDIKKGLGLFRAPYAVATQTGKMSWETLPAEIAAVEKAASEVLNKTVSDVKVVNERIANLKRKQASHIVPDVSSMNVAGEQVNIKNWKAANLQADTGYVNSYVNTIQQSGKIIENFNNQHIDEAAKTLNISVEEVARELDKLKKGIHPTTRKSAGVLRQVAMTDPGYQGQAAAAGLGVRLSGDYYETLGSRTYDPAKDASAAKTTERKIQKLQQQIASRSLPLSQGINFEKLKAQTAGTGGGANMIAGVRAGQQAKYDKQDTAILEAMGIKNARSAITATEREAQTASPSRRTRKIGQDIARGLEVGMADRQDDVALAGSQLSQAATGGVRGGSRQIPFTAPGQPGSVARNIPTTPGMNINDIAAKARFNRDALLATQAQKQTEKMNARMNSLNKAFMSGTFALSALSGVASMSSGNLGKFSEILFKITGPLFALSSILQLLTGEKILKTLRAIGLLRFGAAAIAIGAFIVATKLITKAKEEERRRLYAFGDALRTTEKQIKATGDYFGVTVKKSPLQTGAVVTATKSAPTLRNKINEFKESDLFKSKEYTDQIKNLKVLNAGQARTVLLLKTQELLAQGYSEESINVIISSLQEAAGQEKLNLVFKKIDIEALNKDILGGLKTQLTELSSVTKFEEALVGIGSTTGKGASAFVKKQIVETKEYKAALDSASVGVKSFFDSLAIMQANNTISGTKLKESFGAMVNKIKTEIPDAATQIQLFNLVMKDMTNPLAVAATSTDNLQKKIKLLNAAMLGAAIPTDVVNKFLNGFLFEQDVAEKIIDGILADAEKLQNKLEKIFSGGTVGGKKEVNVLQKMINDMTQQTTVFNKLIKQRVEYKQALELSNNAEARTFILSAKNNTEMKKRIALINELNIATKAQAAAELKALPAVDKRLLELDYLKKQVDLREAIIDAQFAPQIKKENDALGIQEQKLEGINKQIEDVRTKQIQPIQNLIDSNNYALQVIALQEDAINEKYDKEIKNLDKIEKANQNIANIQKQRMSIADALTRGDISAAAQAVQDARAENAQSALTGQRDTLTRVRDESIAALGRVEIEKTNKILQLEIATIEKNQLTILESQKTTIENTIAGHNANLKALNTQVDQLKQSYKYGNLTKLEIESLEGLILKAQAAGVVFTKELLAQAAAAERIAAALAAKQAQGRSIEELTAGARDGTITSASVTAAEKATIIQSIKDTNAKIKDKIAELNRITQKRMYGGPILSKGRGGMGAVKAMAFGGRAIGSDTVPAMLTPGEFVMNKGASKAYGPLLERINESKYPGMLSGGGMTQIPVTNISTSMNDNSTAVYNYNLGFSINGANGSAKDIANAVMREIKNVDSQRIRGQRR
jgi:TP901 family phage tail tape measure protein